MKRAEKLQSACDGIMHISRRIRQIGLKIGDIELLQYANDLSSEVSKIHPKVDNTPIVKS